MFIILLLIISQLLKVQNHSLFKKDFLNFRERERNINVCCLSYTPTGALACNPGMCPDWESNRQPFGL